MVRLIASLVGAAFVLVLGIALWGSISGVISDPPQQSAEEWVHARYPLKETHLASDGLFGHYDNRQVQRGFQVFKEICSACHSLNLVHFRDLEQIGYTAPEVKAIAAQWTIEQPSVNPDTGEVTTRKNVPTDPFPAPFANEIAARAANNNAVPPDLSDIIKARHDGPAYVHSLLTGYIQPPAELKAKFPEFTVPEGLHFNPYFPNLNLAMAQQIKSDGQVQYEDGTRPTVDQMSRDVVAFLVWTSEPKLQARHTAGLAAFVFIAIFCFLAWGAYQNVWRDLKH